MKLHTLKKFVFLAAIFSLFFVLSCASVHRPHNLPDFPRASYADEDINGDFPDAVYIKTRTQTFNAYHYYLIRDGKIWYRSRAPETEPKEWILFERTGLPHGRKLSFRKTHAVVEISADADELAALSAEGGFYRYCFDKTIAHKSNVWLDRQGWPGEAQLYLDERTAKNRAWALGKRNKHVLYYEDPFGNQHHNGTMEIVTTYVLLEDGQEICYGDTGLPSDFSRNYAGPERGRFKALSLSASASTMFVINEAGEMYTRIADFDIVGCDPMFFKYTYVPYTSGLKGTSFLSNFTEWGLPAEDWRSQPRIPLAEKAAITRFITILQNGQGNGARELRVAGRGPGGETGYWSKLIFADAWEFREAPLYFPEASVLTEASVITEVASGNTVRGERGQSQDRRFSGYWWTDNKKETVLEYEIPDFNILEGECELRIKKASETCVLKLHPIELWTFLKRDYQPGRNGPPKLFFATLEIPENAFDGISEGFALFLGEKFAGKNKLLFQYVMAASENYIFLRDRDNTADVLFLTSGAAYPALPEFQRTWYIENYEELRRYMSPELIFDGQYGELRRKITLNKTFKQELKDRIKALGRDKSAAIGLDMFYLPLHYIVRYSPLRFLDLPKVRTMTSYGDKIVLANSAYVDTISTARSWVDKKIMELLDVRIACYEDMAKSVSMPRWYSDTISGYWDIAGLPSRIEGAFFTPSPVSTEQIPAVLTFRRDNTGQEYFGWQLAMGDRSFFIFIDPQKSAKTIYKRGGKSPERQPIQLDCMLYVNPAANSAAEKNIIDRCLTPFTRADRQGVGARITFDGDTFEIREYPAAHGSNLIFRGRR
jgi:hypothetical protein